MIVVFDIGGTSIKYAGWKENQLVSRGNFSTPDCFEKFIAKMKEIVGRYDNVEGVAISSPGAVNVEKGCIKV